MVLFASQAGLSFSPAAQLPSGVPKEAKRSLSIDFPAGQPRLIVLNSAASAQRVGGVNSLSQMPPVQVDGTRRLRRLPAANIKRLFAQLFYVCVQSVSWQMILFYEKLMCNAKQWSKKPVLALLSFAPKASTSILRTNHRAVGCPVSQDSIVTDAKLLPEQRQTPSRLLSMQAVPFRVTHLRGIPPASWDIEATSARSRSRLSLSFHDLLVKSLEFVLGNRS